MLLISSICLQSPRAVCNLHHEKQGERAPFLFSKIPFCPSIFFCVAVEKNDQLPRYLPTLPIGRQPSNVWTGSTPVGTQSGPRSLGPQCARHCNCAAIRRRCLPILHVPTYQHANMQERLSHVGYLSSSARKLVGWMDGFDLLRFGIWGVPWDQSGTRNQPTLVGHQRFSRTHVVPCPASTREHLISRCMHACTSNPSVPPLSPFSLDEKSPIIKRAPNRYLLDLDPTSDWNADLTGLIGCIDPSLAAH